MDWGNGMVDSALSRKLQQVLDYADSALPDGNPYDATGHKRLVRALESKVPAFWDLETNMLANIIETEGKRLTGRIMEADPQALGLEVRRQKPQYQIMYQDPEYREQLRIRNTPFEELIEQCHPGLLGHVSNFVGRLEFLGLKSEYEMKRRTASVEMLNAGIMVRRITDAEYTPILSLTGYGKIICRSVQTGALKPFLTSHVIALSREFECKLSYDHEEWLLTSEEMKNIVMNGGYACLEDALAHRPHFAPFVSVDIGRVLPDRADHWISLVEHLLFAIEHSSPETKPSGLRVTSLTKPSDLYFPE